MAIIRHVAIHLSIINRPVIIWPNSWPQSDDDLDIVFYKRTGNNRSASIRLFPSRCCTLSSVCGPCGLPRWDVLGALSGYTLWGRSQRIWLGGWYLSYCSVYSNFSLIQISYIDLIATLFYPSFTPLHRFSLRPRLSFMGRATRAQTPRQISAAYDAIRPFNLRAFKPRCGLRDLPHRSLMIQSMVRILKGSKDWECWITALLSAYGPCANGRKGSAAARVVLLKLQPLSMIDSSRKLGHETLPDTHTARGKYFFVDNYT